MDAIQPLPVACERTRTYVSLELDGELSEFERGFLASHIGRCARCQAYRAEVGAFTKRIREATVEAPSRSARIPARAETRLPSRLSAVAAIAVVVVGTVTLLTPTTETHQRTRGAPEWHQTSPNEAGFVIGAQGRTGPGANALRRPSTGSQFIA